jgi:hypothetical protein
MSEAKDLDDLKLRLGLGPVTDERLSSYLISKGFTAPAPSTKESDYSGPSIGPSTEPYGRRHRFIRIPVDDPLQYELIEVWATAEEAEQMQLQVNNEEFLNRAHAALAAGTSARPGSASEAAVGSIKLTRRPLSRTSGVGAMAMPEVAETQSGAPLAPPPEHVGTPGQGVQKSAAAYVRERGKLREAVVARAIGGSVAKGPNGQDLRVGPTKQVRIDVLGKNGEYVIVGGAIKAADFNSEKGRLGNLKGAAGLDGRVAVAVYTDDTPDVVITEAQRILGNNNVYIIDGLGTARLPVRER